MPDGIKSRCSPRLVYSPRYDIRFFGLERLHPFDGRKYSRAWRLLRQHFGAKLDHFWLRPEREISQDELLATHSGQYLQSLRHSTVVASALEMPILSLLPTFLINHGILKPMRWAAMGTVIAARAALEFGLAVNLSGGYHHAKRDQGEGFCVYNDIALAVHHLRMAGLLAETDEVLYVDLDAHLGNGVAHLFFDDSRVKLFDQFNADIYPCHDRKAISRLDCALPLRAFCPGDVYMESVSSNLPTFIDQVCADKKVRLAIYNAGTDILRGDPLGAFNVDEASVRERDRFVIQQLTARRLPILILPSGGYSPSSHRLIADMVTFLLEHYGQASS